MFGGVKTKGRMVRQNSNVFTLFDQRRIAEFKEAFSFIDQNSDGVIDRSDLQELLTSLGKPPADEELDEMLSELPEGTSGLNFTLFLSLMGERMAGVDSATDLLQAFEVLDAHRTGSISADQFKEYMTGMGDCLTEEEFEAVLRGTELDARGHVDYRQLVKTLTHAEQNE